MYYGFYRLDADQTAGISAGAPVRFTVTENGNIPLSSYRFTLPCAGTYAVSGAVSAAGSVSAAYLLYSWHNVTSDVAFGNRGYGIAQSHTSIATEQPTAAGIITIEDSTDIELRFVSVSNIVQIYHYVSFAQIIKLA